MKKVLAALALAAALIYATAPGRLQATNIEEQVELLASGPGIHSSAHEYSDTLTAEDLRITAVTPFGFWLNYRLSSNTSRYNPAVYVNDRVIEWDREKLTAYEGVSGRKGLWVAPVYVESLAPDTPVTVAVQQPDGSRTSSLSFETTPHQAIPTPADYALRDSIRDELRTNAPSAWIRAARSQTSGTYRRNNQGAQRAALAATLCAVTQKKGDCRNALKLWQQAVAAREGAAGGGSNHRWRGSFLSQSTGILAREGVLDADQVRQAAEQLIDDLEAHHQWFSGDTDKNISHSQIGFQGAAMGMALLPDGPLRDRYKTEYAFYEKVVHTKLLPMLRQNGRAGMAGGYPLDGTDYGVASITYWLDLIWHLEQVQPELVTQHLPFLINAAYMQAHLDLPDGSGRFSFSDIERPDTSPAGASTSVSQNQTRILLAYLLQKRGRIAEPNHMRAISQISPHQWCALANDSQIGDQRLETVYVNHAGTAAGVYARTGWGKKDAALAFHAGGRNVHHDHADVLHISWFDRKLKLRENPGYLGRYVFGGGKKPAGQASNHNVPVGQTVGQGAGPGVALIQDVAWNGPELTATARVYSKYPEDFTRTLVWDTQRGTLTVTDTGDSMLPPPTSWIGAAKVSASESGNQRVYVIQ